jgi:hypothetical protein
MFGLIFLAVTTGVAGLNWSNVWPAFLLMFGIEPVLQAILDREVSPRRRGWLAAYGSFFLMLGVYFFTITLGAFSWSQQETQWPLYLIILGVAALIGYFASGLRQNGYLAGGLSATLLGGGLLAATLSGLLINLRWQWFEDMVRWFGPDWETTWWPVFPIITGLVLLIFSAIADSPGLRSGLALPGTIALLTGGFFLATTLGAISWEDQGRLWPLYPFIVGVANVVAYFASDARQRIYLILGGAFGAVGAVFLSLNFISGDLAGQLWPLILIVVGALLFVPWTRGHGPRSLGTR